MLSYRHSFHAGNFADVLKHVVLVEVLQYLVKKETPFEYLDTHAGSGMYDLRSEKSEKIAEYLGGIGKLSADAFPELREYFSVLESFNTEGSFRHYPGSPSIANYFLRRQDRAWLYELHSADWSQLNARFSAKKKVRVDHSDGFKGLAATWPPTSRRGLVLIDPSYEIKSDYDKVFDETLRAYKKFPSGVYAIWYPVVDRQRIDALDKKFTRSEIKNIQRFELGVSKESDGYGMNASGLYIINPPWTLLSFMQTLLPRLATTLGVDGEGQSCCEVLVGE